MLDLLLGVYRSLFARKCFQKFNKVIYLMSLHGLGILNYKTDKQSGEDYFLRYELKCPNEAVVFDVGANIGDYSLSLMRLNEKLNIYAFEPHPITYRQLDKNTQLFDIKIFNIGIGAKEGSLVLYDYESNDGSEHASLYKDVIEQLHKGQSVEHKVNVITLDQFALQHDINKIYLLKIDTEGHELEVLKGAKKLLQEERISMIQLEFNEMNVVSRVFFKDIWDLLPNYNLYRMLPDGLVPINNYFPVFCEIFAYQNIVAKLKEKNE